MFIKKKKNRIYWVTRVTHNRLSMVYFAAITMITFAHSSVRGNKNSLLECGPKIRYMKQIPE